VRLFGLILANGSPSGTDSGGGDGGDISIEAEFGDITIAADMLADGAGPDGAAAASISRRSQHHPAAECRRLGAGGGWLGFGGEIDVDAGISLSSFGDINASGGDSGGDIFILTGRDAAFNMRSTSRVGMRGSFGGTFFVERGEGKGSVTVADRMDAGGGTCGGERGCGVAGSIEIVGCDVTVAPWHRSLHAVRRRARST